MMITQDILFPRLAGLPLAGKAMTIATPRRRTRPATLSRRELRRLIADMVD